MNKYEKMWERMKNALWKCYLVKNNNTVRWSDILYIMNRVEMEINSKDFLEEQIQGGNNKCMM